MKHVPSAMVVVVLTCEDLLAPDRWWQNQRNEASLYGQFSPRSLRSQAPPGQATTAPPSSQSVTAAAMRVLSFMIFALVALIVVNAAKVRKLRGAMTNLQGRSTALEAHEMAPHD